MHFFGKIKATRELKINPNERELKINPKMKTRSPQSALMRLVPAGFEPTTYPL